jgi:phospholipid/cholesterol/gamma-HCH transport system substrate-binding protein
LAMRQHTLGPYPLDPSLLSQGIPIDGRVTMNEHTFGPVDGTPLPPAAAPPPAAPPGPAAPSAFGRGGSKGPSVAVTTYDPKTGRYVTPDGHLEQLLNLSSGAAPTSWTDLLPTT